MSVLSSPNMEFTLERFDRPGLNKDESYRLNNFYNSIIVLKYAHENAIKALRKLPFSEEEHQKQGMSREEHYTSGDTVLSVLSQWAITSNNIDHQPGEEELSQLRAKLKELDKEYLFYRAYYNTFRFKEDVVGVFMATGEALNLAQIAGGKLLENIRKLEEDTF